MLSRLQDNSWYDVMQTDLFHVFKNTFLQTGVLQYIIICPTYFSSNTVEYILLNLVYIHDYQDVSFCALVEGQPGHSCILIFPYPAYPFLNAC